MLKTSILSLIALMAAMVLSACGSGSRHTDEVKFCNANQIGGMKVKVDFANDKGVWEDVIMPLEACDAVGTACIKFPILFSVPADNDWASRLPYSWQVGSAKFEIEPAENTTKEAFLITAENEEVEMLYRYEKDRGIISFRLGKLEEDRWNLCGGHLTFDRLKEWQLPDTVGE